MADGLTTQDTTLATIPSGSKVATDDAGAAGHVQVVKLAIATDGSATALPGDATDGLLVNLGANNDVTVSGVSTSAKQDTIIGHLDGVEGLLTTIDADTGTLAGAVAGTEVQVDVVAALPAGANAIGKLAANSGVDIGDVDVTSIAAGTNTIGAVNVKPATSGGTTIFRSLDLDETEEEIKGTAGQVFGWYIYNDGAAEVYVKFYNATAANTTVGTTTPVLTLGIPAGSAANVEFTNGIAFGTAITAAATTGVGDADTTAPAANQVVANVFYA